MTQWHMNDSNLFRYIVYTSHNLNWTDPDLEQATAIWMQFYTSAKNIMTNFINTDLFSIMLLW